jgi:hypothetical protein
MLPMNRRLAPLCLVALLAPVAAQAQLVINPAADPTLSTYTFNDSECGTSLVVQWQLTRLLTPSNDLLMWATAGSCADAATGSDVQVADISLVTLLASATPNGTFTVKLSTLPGFATTLADGGVNGTQCGTQGVTLTQRICGAYPYNSGVSQLYQRATSLALVYDTQPPAAPTIVSQTGVDGTITVSFTVDSDTDTVSAEVKGPDDAAFRGAGTVSASATSITITGLANGAAYQVRLKATDGAGNVSAVSAAVTVTPVATVGFFDYLHDAGITEPGGCAVTGAPAAGEGGAWSLGLSALVPLGALALARTLRRRSQR